MAEAIKFAGEMLMAWDSRSQPLPTIVHSTSNTLEHSRYTLLRIQSILDTPHSKYTLLKIHKDTDTHHIYPEETQARRYIQI